LIQEQLASVCIKSFRIFCLVFLFTLPLKAEDKLEFKQIFTEIPKSGKLTLQQSFSKESLPYWGVIAGSTALFYRYDEEMYAELQRKGRDWKIGNQDNTKSAVTWAGQELLRLPSDTGSFLYFLGDGWMHVGIGGAFIGAGQIQQDNHAYNTGLMIWHGMIVSTIFNQTLKRSFGRESPEVSRHKRGNWRPFPSFNEYNTKTASYDAMPSGHVMTATLTFTILSERYPDKRTYIYPIAGLWLSALMFQMVNNGVHWVSDYPLGIAMGYVIGKIVTQMGEKPANPKEEETAWKMIPTFNGFAAVRQF
jgi:membrane-associated phospholipid phosphatase